MITSVPTTVQNATGPSRTWRPAAGDPVARALARPAARGLGIFAVRGLGIAVGVAVVAAGGRTMRHRRSRADPGRTDARETRARSDQVMVNFPQTNRAMLVQPKG